MDALTHDLPLRLEGVSHHVQSLGAGGVVEGNVLLDLVGILAHSPPLVAKIEVVDK